MDSIIDDSLLLAFEPSSQNGVFVSCDLEDIEAWICLPYVPDVSSIDMEEDDSALNEWFCLEPEITPVWAKQSAKSPLEIKTEYVSSTDMEEDVSALNEVLNEWFNLEPETTPVWAKQSAMSPLEIKTEFVIPQEHMPKTRLWLESVIFFSFEWQIRCLEVMEALSGDENISNTDVKLRHTSLLQTRRPKKHMQSMGLAPKHFIQSFSTAFAFAAAASASSPEMKTMTNSTNSTGNPCFSSDYIVDPGTIIILIQSCFIAVMLIMCWKILRSLFCSNGKWNEYTIGFREQTRQGDSKENLNLQQRDTKY